MKIALLRPALAIASIVLQLPDAGAQSCATQAVLGAGGVFGNHTLVHGPIVTGNGRFVAFASSASNLVAGDTNGVPDAFVHDRATGAVERVSVAGDGTQANDETWMVAISDDGRYVAFASHASNLVAGDTNGGSDVFVRDTLAGTTERVSVTHDGAQSTHDSVEVVISADGRFVAFLTRAALVADDVGGFVDVYVRDRELGTTELASRDSSGVPGNSHSGAYVQFELLFPLGLAISADGRRVAFPSFASNLGGIDASGPGGADLYVRDLPSGTTLRAGVASGGVPVAAETSHPALSGDGRYVAFHSEGADLVPDDTNGVGDIFRHDLVTLETTRVSLGTGGVEGNAYVAYPSAISRDGRRVAFSSLATNLVVDDTNGASDAFVHDVATGVTTRASLASDGTQGGNASFASSLSASGHLVGMSSFAANFVPGSPGFPAPYVRSCSAPYAAFCFGDGSGAACPCGNSGLPGHGCRNSATVRGAELETGGEALLGFDTLELTSTFEPPGVMSIVLQGDQAIAPVAFGDGLRCVGGSLKRLYLVQASAAGVASAPAGDGPAVSARSAELGDAIAPGSTRWYQVYYRDPVLEFCPGPQGSSFNVSNGAEVPWAP